jgi:cobalt-zinc-cadmium efflux system outer membrane protein
MRRLHHRLLTVAACAALAGCRTAHHATTVHSTPAATSTLQLCEYRDPAVAATPAADGLVGPQPVETYVRYALDNNPDIQAARQRVAAARNRIPQAGSLEDPMLGIDTQAPPTMPEFGVNVSQKFPWLGKLETQADMARWSTSAAQAQRTAVELSVVEEVKRAYYELYFVQQAIRISETDRELLVDLTQIADSKYRTGAVSQQDVLRAQLEVANLDSELIRLRQQLSSARARLARQLHVSPDTPLGAADKLSAEQIPGDLDALYAQAVAARPELQAQLATVGRERRAVDLAGLQYYPDATVSFGWMDMPPVMPNDPYTFGVMVNLPVYRERLAAGVREAQANVRAECQRYDSLKDQTFEEVRDLFVQVQTQQELLQLFREEILPKAEQTLRVSSQAYQSGQVGVLQLVDNWRDLLQFQLTYQRLEAQLRQTMAELERTVGGYAALQAATDAVEPDRLLVH